MNAAVDTGLSAAPRQAGRSAPGQARLPQCLEGVRPRRGRLDRQARRPRHLGRPRRGEAGGRRPPCRPRDPPGRDLHHHGAVGLRQVDAGALHVAPRRADLRHRRVRGQGPPEGLGCRTDRAPPPSHGHGVPELRAAAAPQCAREHRLPAQHPGHRPGEARGARPRGHRARRPARARALLSARALRRPAAARRHRAQPRHQARGVVPRRAVLGARPRSFVARCRTSCCACRGVLHKTIALHHSRLRRGDPPRRPHRHHEGRRGDPDRHAGGARRQSGHRLRRRVHPRCAAGQGDLRPQPDAPVRGWRAWRRCRAGSADRELLGGHRRRRQAVCRRQRHGQADRRG